MGKRERPNPPRRRRLRAERLESRRLLAADFELLKDIYSLPDHLIPIYLSPPSPLVTPIDEPADETIAAMPVGQYQALFEDVRPMITDGTIGSTGTVSKDVFGVESPVATSLPLYHYFIGDERIDLHIHPTRVGISYGNAGAGVMSVEALGDLEYVRKINSEFSIYESQGDAARRAFSVLQSGGIADVLPVFVISSTKSEVVLVDELIVSLKPGTDAAKFFGNNKSFSGYRRLDGTTNQYVATVASGTGFAALSTLNSLQYSKPEGIDWIEPNFHQSWTRSYVPNDPRFGNQWHLNNTGQRGALIDADADLPEAWDINRGGSPDFVIGIVDDGVENHPDLRLWSNPGEIPGNNIDDDSNGWIDDINGWNFVSDNNLAGHTTSTDRHGTSVAGVAAATGDNDRGVAGASFNSMVSSARIFEGNNVASNANIASALYYMGGRTRDGLSTWKSADLVNNSWGGAGNSTAINDALAWGTTAGRKGLGAPYVFASGNGFQGTVSYPASRSADTPGVFSIGATNSSGVRSDYSNFGSALDFVAPSSNIAGNFLRIDTTDRTGSDGYNSGGGDPDPDYTGFGSTGFGGTSSAAPLVAGIAALVMDTADDLGVTLSPAALRDYLRQTTDIIGSVEYDMATGKHVEYGYGRLNAATAVSGIGKPEISVLASSGELVSGLGSVMVGMVLSATTKDVMLRVRNQGTSPLNLTSVSVGTGDFSIVTGFGDNVLSVGEATTFVLRYAPASPGADSSTVTIVSNDSSEGTFTFSVDALAVISFPPIANADRLSTAVDTPLFFDTAFLLANDTDDLGSPLFDTIMSGPTNGVLIGTETPGRFRYTPNQGFYGRDSFVYQIVDSNGQLAFATVFVYVGSSATRLFAFDNGTGNSIVELNPLTGALLNRFPSPVGTNIASGFGMAYANEALFVGGFDYSDIFVLNPDTGATLQRIPNPGRIPIDGMAVIDNELFVLDGYTSQIPVINLNTGTVVRVLSVDDSGYAVDALTAAGGRLLAYSLIGGNLSVIDPFTGSKNPAYPLLGDSEGFGVIGGELFRARGRGIDVHGLSTGNFVRSITGLIDLEAIGADDPTPLANFSPFVASDRFVIDTDFTGSISISSSGLLGNDLDGDGDSLTFVEIVSQPTLGTLTEITPGVFQYSTPTGRRGSDSFTYAVSDGTASSTGTVFIELIGNDPPVAQNDSFVTSVDLPVLFSVMDLLSNDYDDRSTHVFDRFLNGPANGSLAPTSNLGEFHYTPRQAFLGIDSVTYQIVDSGGLTGTANVFFRVGPEVTLTSNPYIDESAGTSTITATLSATSNVPVTIELGFTGTATLNSDYVITVAQIVIAPGQTTGTVTVTAVQDTLEEDNERIIVDITSVSNGFEATPQQAFIGFIDDDASLSFRRDVTVTEGNSGTATAEFVVRLSRPLSRPVTVNFTTADNTATETADYTPSQGTLTFASGETTQTIVVPVFGDLLVELDETFFVNLTDPTNATILDNQAIGMITNDDYPITPINLYDGEGFRWDVLTSGGIDGGAGQGFSYAYHDGLHHSGFPFGTYDSNELNNRQIVLGPRAVGGVAVTRKVYVPNNEGFARFLEIVTNTSAVPVTYIVPIRTNLGSDGFESFVTTSSGDVFFDNSDDWIVTDDFEVTGDPGDPAVVHVIDGPGGIEPSVTYRVGQFVNYDYTLTLQPGQTQIVMHFGAQNANQARAIAKAPMLAALGLGATAGLTPTERSQIVNFNLDTATPAVTLTVNNATIAEAAATSTITATLSAPSSLPVTIDLGFSGTATLTDDYTRTGTQIVIPAGHPSGTVTVTAVQDTLVEGNETIIVDITSVTNAIEAVPQQQTVTITDDDLAAPTPNLIDGEGYLWDVQTSGGLLNGTNDAYDLYGHEHVGFPTGTAYDLYEINNRQIVLGPRAVGSVQVTRKVYVPSDQGFARFLEIVYNPTASTVDYTLRIKTNLGSDGSERFVRTSSGDVNFGNADDWIITDDNSAPPTPPDLTDPTIVHIIDGLGGIEPSAASLSPGFINYEYTLTLQPRQTQIVMHFGAQNASQAIALTKATTLAALGLGATADLTEIEKLQIVNFDLGPQVTLSVSNSTIAEAAGTSTITALLSAPSSLPVTIDLGFTGTATLTDDYTRTGMQIVIPAGEPRGTVTVTSVQDTLVEANETIIVDITGVTNGTEATPQQQTVTITDDDAAGTLTGWKWEDEDGDGQKDPGERGLAGVTIYVDLNNNDQLDGDEPRTVTMTDDLGTPTMDETGIYVLGGLLGGTYIVREVVPVNFLQTYPVVSSVGGSILLISDTNELTGVAAALAADGHSVTELANESAAGSIHLTDLNYLDNFSFVVWGASGLSGSGEIHPSTVYSTLEQYIQQGGHLLVTGYDTLASPTDPELASLVRSTTTFDVGGDRLTTSNLNHFILNGPAGDRRGVTIDPAYGDWDGATADTSRGAISLASHDGTAFDAIIYTETAGGGSVGYWTGGEIGTDAATSGKTDWKPGTLIQSSLDILRNWAFGVTQASTAVPDNGFWTVELVSGETVTNIDFGNRVLASVPPVVTIDDVTVTEGDTGTTNATFSVTLSAASAQTVTVNFATANSTAIAPGDYTDTSGTLTFMPGQRKSSITVPVVGDLQDEINETFFVNLSSPTNATIADNQGVGTITDDDLTPSLSINDVAVTEGNIGETNATFTLVLSAPSARLVSVYVGIAENTATGTMDYISGGGLVDFEPGETTKVIVVPVIGDLLDEPDETFLVRLSDPTNATIADNQGVGTITDDDLPPSLSIDDVTVTEGNSGTTNATFTVTLSAASGQTVSLFYVPDNNTATAAADFTSISGALDFAPGETTKTIVVPVLGDLIDEVNETFFVNLTPPTNATIEDSQGLGTIIDDDPAPSLSISDATLTEGDSGETNATFTVYLSYFSGQTVTVNYATANNTASEAADYTSAIGLLTFAPYETTKTIIVPVAGDMLDEPHETFLVRLSDPTNATIADNQGVGTITDDDLPPSLSIDDVTVTEGNSGTTNATFTVTLSAASGQTVSLFYVPDNNTATAAADFTLISGALDFAPGETTKTIVVQVLGDLIDELNETYFVNLTSPTNATIADNQGLGTIIDDDDAPSLSINDVTVTEGNSGTTNATFTVNLSYFSGQTVTVDYATANNTATATSDYSNLTGTMTFAPGETTKVIVVPVFGDLLHEINETFFVNLSTPANATIADNQAIGTIINFDAIAPTANISLSREMLTLAIPSLLATLRFSEPVANLSIDDIFVNSAIIAKSNLTQLDATTYTVALQARPGFSLSTLVGILDSYNDLSGNQGTVAAKSFQVDTLGPTVSIALSRASLSSTLNSTTATFNFSEPVEEFDVNDIVTTIGSPSNFTRVDSQTFTAFFVVASNLSGEFSIGLNAGSYRDLPGNLGEAGTIPILIDTTQPVIREISVNGSLPVRTPNTELIVDFSEAVFNFDSTDVVLTGTASQTAIVGTPVKVSDTRYRVPINGLRTGSLLAAIATEPGDIVDADGLSVASRNSTFSVVVPNLFPTSASIVDASNNPITPSAGQPFWVRVNYTYDDPVNTSYTIGRIVNGNSEHTSPPVSNGPGQTGSVSLSHTWGSWVMHTGGVYEATVRLDNDESIGESSELDNSLTFSFNVIGDVSPEWSLVGADEGRNLLGDGTNVIVGTMDDAFDYKHPWFAGNDSLGRPRLVAELQNNNGVDGSPVNANHATGVMGVILSDGPNQGDIVGLAPDARFVTAEFINRANDPQAEIVHVFDAAGFLVENGAEVINMSWSWWSGSNNDSYTGETSLTGLMADYLAYAHNIIAVPAVNQFTDHAFPTAPGSSRNVITVGGLNEAMTRAWDQQDHGPTPDGRGKPDLLGGTAVNSVSTRANWRDGRPAASDFGGTSFATPFVTGAAAQMLDYGKSNGENTDHRVIKAVLMNSGVKTLDDDGTAWSNSPSQPLDDQQGTGVLNLPRVYEMYSAGEQSPGEVESTGYDFASIVGTDSSTGVMVYRLGSPTSSGALDVTLAWDRPTFWNDANTNGRIDAADTFYTNPNDGQDNLDLLLYRDGMLVASSVSTIDTVEHLHFTSLINGEYELHVVRRDIAGTGNDADYGLAWHSTANWEHPTPPNWEHPTPPLVTGFNPISGGTFIRDYQAYVSIYVTIDSPVSTPTRNDLSISGSAVTPETSVGHPSVFSFNSSGPGVYEFRIHNLGTGTLQLSIGGELTSIVDADGLRLVEANAVYNIVTTADFGDAPASYRTSFNDDGPRHYPTGPQLGLLRDAEPDAFVSSDASGDVDDEDGVTLVDFEAGSTAVIQVLVQKEPGRLSGWFDFNRDGAFAESERLLLNYYAPIGLHTYEISVPGDAVAGTSFARFRISRGGVSGVGGLVDNGEVEDYPIIITRNSAPTISVFGSSYTERQNGGQPIQLQPLGSVNDDDGDADWRLGASLTVQLTNNVEATDELSVLSGVVGNITFANGDILDDGSIIASVEPFSGIATEAQGLTIRFNNLSNQERVQQTLRSIGYRSSSNTPSSLTRSVTYLVTDARGKSTFSIRPLSVTPVISTPVLTAPTQPAVRTQNFVTIRGSAEPGSLIRVYRDLNQNGAVDEAELASIVVQQQLANFLTNFDMNASLTLNSVNHLLVVASDAFGRSSNAAIVPAITQDVPPTAMIELSRTFLTNEENSLIATLRFSEPVVISRIFSRDSEVERGPLTAIDATTYQIELTALPDVVAVETFFGVQFRDAGGNVRQAFESFDINTTQPADTTPPTITALYVSGSGWSQAFIDAVDGGGSNAGNTLGYELSVGSRSIPWANVNRIYLQFSEDIGSLTAADVALLGVNTADYGSSLTVSYKNTLNLATISLSGNLGFDKLRLGVSQFVTDLAGNQLDGDTNGSPGGNFDLRFDVLPGDASGDRRVTTADFTPVSASFNRQAGQANYNFFADFTGDGRVTTADFTPMSANFNRNLNSFVNDPVALSFVSGSVGALSMSSQDSLFSELGEDEEDRVLGLLF